MSRVEVSGWRTPCENYSEGETAGTMSKKEGKNHRRKGKAQEIDGRTCRQANEKPRWDGEWKHQNHGGREIGATRGWRATLAVKVVTTDGKREDHYREAALWGKSGEE